MAENTETTSPSAGAPTTNINTNSNGNIAEKDIDIDGTSATTTPVLATNENEKLPHLDSIDNTADNALAHPSSDSPQEPAAAPAAAPNDASPAPAPPQSQAEKMTTVQIVLLMSALCMSVFLAALDMTIVTTALPTIAEEFGSASGFVWVGSAFMLGSAAATASWGKFSDVFGRKPVLLCANLVFILGCALCGAAPTLPTLIAGRAVQGIGAGGLLTLVNIIIGDLFSARERGKYYGMIGMVWATAGALGPVVGGALTNNVSWRWCFYINLPVSGTAFFIILAILRLPTPKTNIFVGLKSIDWLGTLTITGGTLMLLMGLQFGGTSYSWRSATVICLIVFGVVTLAIFGVIEHYIAKFPVVPTHLYSSRSNLAVLLVCMFHGLAFTQQTYYLPTYFQAVLGASPLMSGVYLLAMSLGVSLCAASSGIYLKKTGRYMDPIMLGFALAVLGSGLLYNLPTSSTSPSAASAWSRIIIYQLISGMGVGLNFQPPLVALQSNVPPQNNASATSSFALTRSMAAAISVVIGSAAFANKMTAQYDTILAAVGGDASTAVLLTGSNAQANLFLVDQLPAAAQTIVRKALYTAIQEIWIQTVCFSAAGLIASFFIKRKKLQYTHEAVKTGMEGEMERRRIALARKKEKKAANRSASKPDLEA